MLGQDFVVYKCFYSCVEDDYWCNGLEEFFVYGYFQWFDYLFVCVNNVQIEEECIYKGVNCVVVVFFVNIGFQKYL